MYRPQTGVQTLRGDLVQIYQNIPWLFQIQMSPPPPRRVFGRRVVGVRAVRDVPAAAGPPLPGVPALRQEDGPPLPLV